MKRIFKSIQSIALTVVVSTVFVSCNVLDKDKKTDIENDTDKASVVIQPDTTVDDMSFSMMDIVVPGSLVESNIEVVSGINQAVNISITGGEFKIGSQDYTSVESTINNGDTLQLRMRASPIWNTQTQMTLSISDQEFNISMTTIDQDVSPETISFADVVNVATNVWVESELKTVTGITGDVLVSIDQGEFSIDGGLWSNEPRTITNNQTIQVRTQSSDSFGTLNTTSLSIGDEVVNLLITTEFLLNDEDYDNDGVNDLLDEFPLNSKEWMDSDGDQIGDNEDRDDDNDGVYDSYDASPLNALNTKKPEWVTVALIDRDHVISDTTYGAYSVVTVDLDGDGDLDVLSASSSDDTVAWFENDGHQLFEKHVIDNMADQVGRVQTADMDSDGDLDVVVTFVGAMAWYENNGQQMFEKHIATHLNSSPNYGIHSFDVSDMDGDGDMDLMSHSVNDNHISWYENDGEQQFTHHLIDGNTSAWKMLTADIDGDGDMDVLSASLNEDSLVWYENNGQQVFIKHVISDALGYAFSIDVADLDNDGDLDLVIATLKKESVIWYENDGQQNFIENSINDTKNGAWEIKLADVDADGDMDVFTAWFDGTIGWLENNGDQIFYKHIIDNRYKTAWSLDSGDIEGDGDLELFTASHIDDEINWYDLTEQTYQVYEGVKWVGTQNATDEDAQTLRYYLSGGPDVELFEIDVLTGDISFKEVPNFNAPEDFNGDNIYSLNVAVTDGFVPNQRRIEIEVLSEM